MNGPRRLGALSGLAVVLLCAAPARAQTLDPGPPGPFVVDVRGATSNVPADGVDLSGAVPATVPTRGYGVTLGAHAYLLDLGPSRLGLGAEALVVRGTTPDARATVRAVAPHVSFNFGTADGWSYLSAGVGVARRVQTPGVDATVRATHVGGGARWFLGPHLGLGFDIRFHRLAAEEAGTVPGTTLVSAAVGLSFK